MKFNIDRTSDYYGENVLPEGSKFWGRVKTEREGRHFFNTVEIDTIGELMELVREQGEIVVSRQRPPRAPGIEEFTIEIYDTYRE